MSKKYRIDVVDALRGFAIMAILFVHAVEHFHFFVYPDSAANPNWLNVLNQGVSKITFNLFAGKAYAIFALLFGFSFFIQFYNRQKEGEDYGYRFLWRLLILVLFATLNAILYPAGDILLLYAIVGLFLFVVRHWSNKAIFCTALFFLLQPAEWFHYIASLFNPDYKLPDFRIGQLFGEVFRYISGGNLREFIIGNLTVGQKASLSWAIGAGRFSQTIGLFLLGYYIGRKQYFNDTPQNYNFWVKVLVFSAVLFAPLYMLKVELYDNASVALIRNTVGTAFDMWQKFVFMMVLIAAFVLLYRFPKTLKILSKLRNYGKMSLTNYISQSLIGALIFFPIGLNLAQYSGYALSFMIGICVFIFQLAFSNWWMSKYKKGPLEQLWRNLVWIGRNK
ncbi:DUF418 domain-containing protein [Natronoflexus pectinivorans]|uniref:DUF418 domain-containing protein n=1 Tax=Natronoflexus pectinivorans TaxID=682526 RepID=A0A4R2GL45_9BACT|nr:DUF418 domain-containing protein [Natronoflexus pectinivorans]TCO09702.1 uncharacterized protein EV194_102128 [Natronoflexus pectinivorans]